MAIQLSVLGTALSACCALLAGCSEATDNALAVTAGAVPAAGQASAAAPAADSLPTSTPQPQAAKPAAPQPPAAALPYRSELTRTARAVWGLDAPVPVFAAQIHQESGWRADAVSPVGALGLAQFMPATAKWIVTVDPQLAGGQPYNPAWAMRALVVYDQNLYGQAPARYAPRDRMWVALRGYNGGIGHWVKEAKATGLTTPTREQVDAACGKASRAAKHCAENLGYPKRILIDHQPRYAAWGPML
jgi:soluble lytic murein transglycosylase-like protein